MRQLRSNERYDITMCSRILFHVYADSRPHVLQTKELQKGIVVVCQGAELIEEGLGTGAPVCTHQDGTRFLLNADTFDDSGGQSSVVKVYEMNSARLN